MPMPINLAEISALIRHRRSIKPAAMDPSKEVDRALLSALLENATWAPSHGMTEPWRFRVYEGTTREALAAALQRIYKEVTPVTEQLEDKFAKLRDNVLNAPIVIACSMQRSGVTKIPELEEIEAVACALQNLMLSAAAVGLGSFWSSPPLLESGALKDWLGLEAKDRCVGLMYLGWPKESTAWPTSARKPLSNCVSWAS